MRYDSCTIKLTLLNYTMHCHYAILCNHYAMVSTSNRKYFRIFSSSQKEILYPLPVVPHPHFLQPVARNNLSSISVNLLTLYISYKWSHTICGLLWLDAFIRHIFKVHHVVSCISSSLPDNVPFYGYTTLFINSPVSGHLGGFHFLAILNYTTMNGYIQVLWGKLPSYFQK